MQFKDHSNLKGKHAFLAPSSPYWIRYDDDKVLDTYDRHMNALLGTELHELAHKMIGLGIKPENNSKTFNMYVTDCIGFGMQTEIPLVYSEFCFGTADAITYHEVISGEPWVLRIFDLKNGTTKTTEEQLEVYAALFCLEYSIDPYQIYFDLRIYQNDDVLEFDTDPDKIAEIMDIIKHESKLLASAKEV